jgi:hypothetical protein
MPVAQPIEITAPFIPEQSHWQGKSLFNEHNQKWGEGEFNETVKSRLSINYVSGDFTKFSVNFIVWKGPMGSTKGLGLVYARRF